MRKRSGFFRESIPKREIEMIQKTIERKRKLSAEVCWEIVHLRDNRCLSWSQIAEHLQEHFQLSVSIRAIIKGYKKAKKALATNTK